MRKELTRRDFLRASSAIAAALGLQATGLGRLGRAVALEPELGGAQVVWLEAQSCSGCSVSLLNSIHYDTIDSLCLNALDLQYHPALMAAAGNLAVSAAEKAYRAGGYVLVVEGSIPTAAGGEYCHLWPGLTAEEGVERFARRASFILAVGTCASYGGVVAGSPNPTGARGLEDSYFGKQTIRIPGCPSHPDWIVGTIAHILAHGQAPDLDPTTGRPVEFFQRTVHSQCPYKNASEASALGEAGCLESFGCNGRWTGADCPTRQWNSDAKGAPGVNWCIGAGSPCIGCTEPGFPDDMTPFYNVA